jgi:hypothetical protein
MEFARVVEIEKPAALAALPMLLLTAQKPKTQPNQ